MLQFAEDMQPDACVMLGDVLDVNSLNRYNVPARSLRTASFELNEERKQLEPILQSLLVDCEEVYWLEGNHEARRKRIIDLNPGLLDLPALEARNFFDIPDEVEWIPQGQRLKIGPCYFEHGDKIINSRGGSVHVANSMQQRRPQCNTFTGHWHCIDWKRRIYYTDTGPVEFITASCGHLSKTDEHHYVSLPNWSHGFVYIEMDGDDFWPYQIRIKDGKARFGGREYGR